MTDEELKRQSFFLRREFQSGRLNEEELMVRAFAVAREGARRTIGLYPFPVQLLGAIFLTKSAVIEMKTGEGKSLVAVMPVYFNYLRKKNTQVITVNEYLAERDAN